MELESLRMHETAAADATIGINAMIDALPIMGADVRPPHITLYSSVDAPWVARKTVSEKGDGINFPAIALFLHPVSVHEVMTSVRDADVAVVLAYIARNSDNPKTQRDSLYTDRAMLRFLRRFADNANAGMRLLNGVQLLNPISGTQQGQLNQSWDKAVAISATVITWLTRDTSA